MLVTSIYIYISIYKQTQSENPKNCPERDLNPRPRLSGADVLTTTPSGRQRNNVAPHDLPLFTRTTPKARFYDPELPQNHTKRKGEGREERGGEKKDSWHS